MVYPLRRCTDGVIDRRAVRRLIEDDFAFTGGAGLVGLLCHQSVPTSSIPMAGWLCQATYCMEYDFERVLCLNL